MAAYQPVGGAVVAPVASAVPAHAVYVPEARFNPLAIVAFVCVFLWIWFANAVVAIVLGVFALRQIREHDERGRGLAIAAVVLGTVEVLGGVLALVHSR